MLKALLRIFLALTLLAAPAQAQVPPPDPDPYINSLIYPNGQGSITGATTNQVLKIITAWVKYYYYSSGTAPIQITAAGIANTAPTVTSILVTGHDTPGDPGAGAVYVPGIASGPDPHQDLNGQWWNVVTANGVVNPGWFGAKCLGAAGPDDSQAFLNAVAAIAGSTSLASKTLYIPSSQLGCHIEQPIVLTGSNWTVYGDGLYASTIVTNSTTMDMIQIDQSVSRWTNHNYHDFGCLYGQATPAPTTLTCIHAYNHGQFQTDGGAIAKFTSLAFRGVAFGLHFDRAQITATDPGQCARYGQFQFLNLASPNTRGNLPINVILFDSGPGAANQYSMGALQSRDTAIKMGDGTECVGDQTFAGIHLNGPNYSIWIKGPDPAILTNAYNKNVIISASHLDQAQTAFVHMENMSNFTITSTAETTASDFDLINCTEYTITNAYDHTSRLGIKPGVITTGTPTPTCDSVTPCVKPFLTLTRPTTTVSGTVHVDTYLAVVGKGDGPGSIRLSSDVFWQGPIAGAVPTFVVSQPQIKTDNDSGTPPQEHVTDCIDISVTKTINDVTFNVVNSCGTLITYRGTNILEGRYYTPSVQ